MKREKKLKQRTNKSRVFQDVVMAFAFLGVLAIFCLVNFIKKDQKMSETENRVLSQKPEITVQSVANGRFMERYEEYVSDQFAGRNFWVQMKTFAGSLGGNSKQNGVFKGKHGYLMEEITVPDEEELKVNLDAMKSFAKAYPDIEKQVMLVPNAANILEDKLPFLAVTADQKELLEKVRKDLAEGFGWIDVEKTMGDHKDEEIYYHTDHHWTTLGAYHAFQAAAGQLGIKDEEILEMKPLGVANDFTGTLAAVSGYQTGYKEPVYIYLPVDKDAPQTVVNYVDEQKKTASLYDSASLNTRNKYDVFLGGNHAQIELRSATARTERLLVIKDSYANCFLPFLAPYFREIQVVDPRYYTGDLGKLIEERGIDRILFLYNANTFFEDRMLAGILPAQETE